MNEAVTQIDRVTQSNAASAEEGAAAAEELQAQAANLKESIGQLVVMIEGAGAQQVAEVPPSVTVKRKPAVKLQASKPVAHKPVKAQVLGPKDAPKRDDLAAANGNGFHDF